MEKIKTKKHFLFIIFSIFVTVLIIFSWFRTGSIISNSEESLNIYNPKKTYEINSTIWYDTDLGSRSPFGINRAYPFLLLTYLENLGIPPYVNQALLIGLTILSALLFSYLFFFYLSKGSYLISFFGSFFYIFNLFTQSQIFRRFLYNFMFALAYYPLFLFLWIKFLDTRRWIYLFFLLVSSVIFSFSFNHPATIFVFFVSALLILLVKIWDLRKKVKEVFKLISLSIVTLILGILVNFWWIFPLQSSGGEYVSSIVNTFESDFGSLKAVSQSFPTGEILLLRQSWWYGSTQHWFEFYRNPIINSLSIVILLITILGLRKSKPLPLWLFLVVLISVALFISKGTNFPLGYPFYYFLFENFSYATVLRNPYEKFGMVFLLPYSFFFAFGLVFFLNKFKSSLRKFLIIISFVLFLIIPVLPIWNGDVFLKTERVNIPKYYKDANSFLNTQGNFRIFHLPLSKTFTQKYDWGFYGQDPSEFLFDRTSVSNTFIPPLNDLFYKHPELAKSNDFPKSLGFLGISNIVLHKDSVIDEKETLLRADIIKSVEGFEKINQFEKLTIYEIKPEFVRSRFYAIEFDDKSLDRYKTVEFPDKMIFQDKFINLNFQKLSPTHFSIQIKEIKKPFILIFNNLYDKAWVAKINSQEVAHFKAFKLVNGFVIEKIGNFTIEVKLKVHHRD